MKEGTMPLSMVKILLSHAIHQPAVLDDAEVRRFADTGITMGMQCVRGERDLPREVARWRENAPKLTVIHDECLREMLMRAATVARGPMGLQTAEQIADEIMKHNQHKEHAHA